MLRTFLLLATLNCLPGAPLAGERHQSLAGSWHFRLDPDDTGMHERWYLRSISGDSIELPGTTDLAGKGYVLDRGTRTYPVPFRHSTFPGKPISPHIDERGFLVRTHMYIGPAWYQRTITIPSDWSGKHIQLFLERILWVSQVWIDDRPVGSCDSLVTPHRYDLGRLTSGNHRLTVRIDNSMAHNLGTIGHAYGPETQSRWNGIIGRMELSALPPISIQRIQVYPDDNKTEIQVVITLSNRTGRPGRATVQLVAGSTGDDHARTYPPIDVSAPFGPGERTTLRCQYAMPGPARRWDEFHPELYELSARLQTDEDPDIFVDQRSTTFGLRTVRRDGRWIQINGRRVFLRGTLDCCVYPQTGHPPVTLAKWMTILRTVKRYGFNHVRFHSWCPPEAAFDAADRLGVYLEPETPFWVDGWTLNTYTHPQALGHDPDVTEYVRREIRRISTEYGNHPSFVLFCIGNEFAAQATDWTTVNELVSQAKREDARHLHSGSTARRLVAADDFWITHNSGRSTRGIGPPHTNWDFSEAAAATDVPVIAHETGQRPVYPEFERLLPGFDGPLKPFNLHRFQEMANGNGLADQIVDFHRASAQHQFTQYKAEHEAMLRTADFGGYQLLMLNDFTGQTEALVGILDPLNHSKGVVTADDVRQWNSPIVLLARFRSFAWTTSDTFDASVEVAHYGPDDMDAAEIEWKMRLADGHVFASGKLAQADLKAGQLTAVGSLRQSLADCPAPAIVHFELRMGSIHNHWTLGVYAPADESPTGTPEAVDVTNRFNEATLRRLDQGRSILFMANRLKNEHSGRYGFASQYWSAAWWGDQFSLLGVMCDPNHPALADFPTRGRSDWFWHDVLDGGVSIDLTGELGPHNRPIIQGVTDFHYNRILGQLFECRVSKGRLLVCGYDLQTDLSHRPAARQLRASLLRYMESSRFAPRQTLASQRALRLFAAGGLARIGATASADSHEEGYEAMLAIDGDPATIWHTQFTGSVPHYPHHLVIKLKQVIEVRGLSVLPRQDQANGRIARFAVYVSNDGQLWGPPKATGEWRDGTGRHQLRFDRPVTGRFIKIEARSEVNRQPFASLAEVDLL